ncbi:LysM peptidoglycan-binding domain-containing protein [Belnapia sp. T6]|uniref:LysM peptidoglycan-binding domain-containing protein n=1 Tax=Belnapia mucosa TaxID=2804532 RepID=A0ABS1V449_9PROT|nr:LysM peptidoglycan-binding domain-containing protein [Belnapia mucosa]MBL6456451.1 LysM peptidoglycan-binding domain-containing protein [Belnapia mucosa]
MAVQATMVYGGAMKLIGLLGLGVLAGGGTLLWLLPETPRPQASSAARPAAPIVAALPPPTAPTQPAPQPPRFDVARVGARGMLVTAGRAAPTAEVTLLEGGREIGRARADGRGEWVILPAEPLPPGLRELSLLARLAGGEAVASEDTVLLLVPEPPAPQPEAPAGRPAMAMLLPPTAGAAANPRLLQTPAEVAPERQRLGLDVVDYDDQGGMRFAGSAPPGSKLRVYVGPDHAGDAVADPAGRWSLTPEHQPSLGRHTLRVDQLAAAGSVAARIELPFQREAISEEILRDGKVIVQPGYSLWRIARQVYGRGLRYTVIYAANRDQIREPRLIYPGQVFAVPEGGPQAESSRSR